MACPPAGLFNFLSNSAAFLVTATTNCVAAALGSGEASSSSSSDVAAARSAAAAERASILLGHALVMALCLGLATAAVIALAPDTLLSLYGVAPGSPLNAAARAYLLVRTVSVPSIFLMFVAVGASLGAGNALAPTTGILAAAMVNLIGDAYLVLYCGAGLAGAAAATAAASWTGSIMVLTRLRRLIIPRFRHERKRAHACVSARAFAPCCCVCISCACVLTLAGARIPLSSPAAGPRLLTWRRCWRCRGRCC